MICVGLFQVKKSDFAEFDYIFGMDDDNMDDLRRLAPVGSKAKIELLGSYDPQGQRLIRDPYYVRTKLVRQVYPFRLLNEEENLGHFFRLGLTPHRAA